MSLSTENLISVADTQVHPGSDAVIADLPNVASRKTNISFRHRVAVLAAVGAVSGILGCSSSTDAPVTDVPWNSIGIGGVWEPPTPKDGLIIGPKLPLCVRVYPAEGYPAIAKVRITDDVDGQWKVAKEIDNPDPKTVYCANEDLSGVPPGEISASFDVINSTHQRKMAPNGVRHLQLVRG